MVRTIKNESDSVEMHLDTENNDNTIEIWKHFGEDTLRNAIGFDRINDVLFIPDSLCNIDVLNVMNGRFVTRLCVKAHRLENQEDRLSNDLNESIFSINVKDTFIYVTTNLYLYILERVGFSIVAVTKLDDTPVKIKFFPVTRIEIENIKKKDKELFISKIIFGFSNKNSLSWNSFYHSITEGEEVKDQNGNMIKKTTSELKKASEGMMADMIDPNYHWRVRPLFNHVQSTDYVNSIDINNAIAA